MINANAPLSGRKASAMTLSKAERRKKNEEATAKHGNNSQSWG